MDKYCAYISVILHLLPKRLAHLVSNISFHDGDFSIEIGDHHSKSAMVNRVTINTYYYKTSHNYRLQYSNIRKFAFNFPTEQPLDSLAYGFAFGYWLYDEIELLDDKWVRHEIMLDSGAQVLIEFKNFTYTKQKKDAQND